MLSKELRVDLPFHFVKEILKANLNLRFKKGKSRPSCMNKDKNALIKSIFVARVAKEIKRFPLLINIDETLFSRFTKSDYFWLEKGKEWIVMSVRFSNSVSVIAVITSAGTVFAAASNGTVTGNLFKEFLKKLKDFIQLDMGIKLEEWLILFDNSSTHQSTIVRNYAVSEGLNFAFIPAYSPEWAPIEKYFSSLKSTAIYKVKGKKINIRTKSSMRLIQRSMNCISNKVVSNLWRNLMNELRCIIDHISDIV